MTKTNEQWTIGSILQWTGQYFGSKGVDNPRLDAEVLLCYILGKERIGLYVNFDQPMQPHELTAFRAVVQQRAARLPVAYITGVKEFMGLEFRVCRDVLIPRPDTEILVEAAIARLAEAGEVRLLDVGTGSGAIIISLLAQLPQAYGWAVDISERALAVAADNAERLHVADRLRLHQGDAYQPVSGATYHAIVSNPPYIPNDVVDTLAPEVGHEPRLALAGGVDGLDFYRRLVGQAAALLEPNGFIALEVGAGQAGQVAALAAGGRLLFEEIVKDYAGIERVVILRKRREG